MKTFGEDRKERQAKAQVEQDRMDAASKDNQSDRERMLQNLRSRLIEKQIENEGVKVTIDKGRLEITHPTDQAKFVIDAVPPRKYEVMILQRKSTSPAPVIVSQSRQSFEVFPELEDYLLTFIDNRYI